MTGSLRAFAHRLLAAPRTAWPLAIARVIIGVAILLWAVTMAFDASTFLGEHALVGSEFASESIRYIDIDTTARAYTALAALGLCSLAIIAGWRPSLFLVIAFVLLVAVQQRNPMILNSGDLILRDLTLLLALTPTGAAMSIDRVRLHGREAFWTSSLVAPWGLRLVQIQIMVVYFFAYWSKSGDLWKNGTAVSTAFRLQDLQRFGQLGVLVDNIWIVALLTWSTLLLELVLGTMLWIKRLRPALIVGGVLLHVMIDTFMLVGLFGIAMIAGLMTFLDADRIDALVQRRRAGRSGERGEAEADVGAAIG